MKYRILLLLALCAFVVTPVLAQDDAITVNCAICQSLNGTLSRLNKLAPTTVFVKGTCTEYVTINGFTSLTLKALPGAALQQPSTNPGNGLGISVLLIEASRSITVDGFAVHSGPSATAGIGAPFHVGFQVNSGHITVQSTTIRNMQVGINIATKGDVDIQGFSSYYPVSLPNDVVIESPAGTNHQGVKLEDGSHLNLGDTKLRITNAGQPGGGNTAAVWVSDSSTLSDRSGNLVISGSQGQGMFVSNNSHATLAGTSITGGSRGGLVAAKLSSISITPSNPPTVVGGNVTDLFCDSRSVITGGANFAGVPIVKCGDLLAGDTEPLP